MDVSISARHVTITPRLEEVIHEKIGQLDRYLDGLDYAGVHFDEDYLAAAGPIIEKRVRFTNNHWVIAADELAEDFSIDAVRLLNDFEAIAYSIPFLTAEDCIPIGLPDPQPLDGEHYMVGILGPGTGLGAVGLKKHGDLLLPIAGEASHGGFAPESHVQIDIVNIAGWSAHG